MIWLLTSFFCIILNLNFKFISSAEQTDPTQNCYDPHKRGETYRGEIDQTESGHLCQGWSPNSWTTHVPDYTVQLFIFGLEEEKRPDHNFCRNYRGMYGRPWCYTSEESVSWEYCDIPRCDDQVGYRARKIAEENRRRQEEEARIRAEAKERQREQAERDREERERLIAEQERQKLWQERERQRLRQMQLEEERLQNEIEARERQRLRLQNGRPGMQSKPRPQEPQPKIRPKPVIPSVVNEKPVIHQQIQNSNNRGLFRFTAVFWRNF